MDIPEHFVLVKVDQDGAPQQLVNQMNGTKSSVITTRMTVLQQHQQLSNKCKINVGQHAAVNFQRILN